MTETELRPLWKNLPQLPLSERDRRLGSIRQQMERQGLECLVIWGTGRGEHIRYVSGLAVRGVALLPLTREPIVFTDLLHIGKYARACSNWVADVREDIENFSRALKEFVSDTAKIGIVSLKVPHTRLPRAGGLAGAALIQAALPGARLVDATAIFDELEMIKSQPEIEMLQRAAEVAYEVFQAIADTARPGATESQVYASMLAAQVASGGDVDSIYLDVGAPSMLHGRVPPYTNRPLRRGDLLITEYHASYAGYLVATEHTFSLGEPPGEVQQIHQVAEQCFRRGMASMTAGTKFADVIAAYRAPADEAGMAYVELGVHGHGLASCEFPTTVFGGIGGILHQHYLGQVPEVCLQENMVFGQNIDLHNPKWNPNTGVMLGDTVWVSAEGPIKLTRVPAELTAL